MKRFIVQYIDNANNYQGYCCNASSYIDAIDLCKRECKVYDILGCMALLYIRYPSLQKGFKPQ